jgi:hypothetical protein
MKVGTYHCTFACCGLCCKIFWSVYSGSNTYPSFLSLSRNWLKLLCLSRKRLVCKISTKGLIHGGHIKSCLSIFLEISYAHLVWLVPSKHLLSDSRLLHAPSLHFPNSFTLLWSFTKLCKFI